MIELENISKQYNSEHAVKEINLLFEETSTAVLIGPSGCGKSTLIRIITGLVNSDQGSVKIDNTKISQSNIQEFRRRMGYVIQDGGLFPHLTAFENVTIMAAVFNWQKRRIIDRVNELSKLTKFPADALTRFPTQLSGGQRQRVSLMRALFLDPDILLLDEPLGALDPLIRYDLQNDLKDIFTSLNKTVITVTHDLAEAVFFGDNIILMKEGSIVQRGTAKEIFNNPVDDFVTKFINAQRGHLDLN